MHTWPSSGSQWAYRKPDEWAGIDSDKNNNDSNEGNSSSSDLVKIIAIIFGMAAFLAIVGAVLFMFLHRKKRKEDMPTTHIPSAFDESSALDESASYGIRDYR